MNTSEGASSEADYTEVGEGWKNAERKGEEFGRIEGAIRELSQDLGFENKGIVTIDEVLAALKTDRAGGAEMFSMWEQHNETYANELRLAGGSEAAGLKFDLATRILSLLIYFETDYGVYDTALDELIRSVDSYGKSELGHSLPADLHDRVVSLRRKRAE